MRRKKIFLLSIFTLLLANFACYTSPTQIEPTAYPTTSPTSIQVPTLAMPVEPGQGSIPFSEAEVPRISPEDAKAALDSGKAIIVDVRSPEAFAASHVESAINIPLASFETDIENISLENSQWIITYCT